MQGSLVNGPRVDIWGRLDIRKRLRDLRDLTLVVTRVKNLEWVGGRTIAGVECGIADSCEYATRPWRSRLMSMPLNWDDGGAFRRGVYPRFWMAGRWWVWRGSELE